METHTNYQSYVLETEKDGFSDSDVVIAVAVTGFTVSILTTAALIMLVYRRQRLALYHPREPNRTVQMLWVNRVRSSISESSTASETQV